MQYAFVRVTDPNSELPKFVQIVRLSQDWSAQPANHLLTPCCGRASFSVDRTELVWGWSARDEEGSLPLALCNGCCLPQGVAHPDQRPKRGALRDCFLALLCKKARGTDPINLALAATFQTDVEPEVILKKLTDSGGAKYSIQQKNAPAQPRDKIAPVGSSYTPVGKVDMGALKSSKPTQSYTPPPPGASFARPTPAPAAAATQAKTFTPPPVKKFTPPVLPPQATARNDDDEADETWGDEPPAPPAPATTPSVPAPKASAPAGSFYKAPTIAPAPAKVEVKAESEKPKEVDRIGKVVCFNRSFGPFFVARPDCCLFLFVPGNGLHPGRASQAQETCQPFRRGSSSAIHPCPVFCAVLRWCRWSWRRC